MFDESTPHTLVAVASIECSPKLFKGTMIGSISDESDE